MELHDTIVVQSIEGLSWTMQEIVTVKPVLIINTEAFYVVPLKAQAGKIIKFTDESGHSVDLRLVPVVKYATS